MRWLLFFLIIPSVYGLGIAASPPTITLENGKGNLLLVNPNNKSVAFSIFSDLQVKPQEGMLEEFEQQHISIRGTHDSNLTITFSTDKEERVKPALFLPVVGEATQFSYFWAVLIMGFGCLAVVLLLFIFKTR